MNWSPELVLSWGDYWWLERVLKYLVNSYHWEQFIELFLTFDLISNIMFSYIYLFLLFILCNHFSFSFEI